MSETGTDIKSMLRNLRVQPKAVILGFLVDFVGTFVVMAIIGGIAGFVYAMNDGDISAFEESIYSNTLLMLFTVLLGSGFTVLGGYIAGRVARESLLFNASLVGVAGIAIGVFFWGDAPLWYDMTGFLLAVPAACLGGLIALKREASVVPSHQGGQDTSGPESGRASHSWVGVSSFGLSILSIVGIILLLAATAETELASPGAILEGEDIDAIIMLVGLFCLAIVVAVIALGLGVAGLIQKQRKRVFPILGVICSSVIVFGMAFLILV